MRYVKFEDSIYVASSPITRPSGDVVVTIERPGANPRTVLANLTGPATEADYAKTLPVAPVPPVEAAVAPAAVEPVAEPETKKPTGGKRVTHAAARKAIKKVGSP